MERACRRCASPTVPFAFFSIGNPVCPASSPRHRGILVAKVERVLPGDGGVVVKLCGPIKRGDGVVFVSCQRAAASAQVLWMHPSQRVAFVAFLHQTSLAAFLVCLTPFARMCGHRSRVHVWVGRTAAARKTGRKEVTCTRSWMRGGAR